MLFKKLGILVVKRVLRILIISWVKIYLLMGEFNMFMELSMDNILRRINNSADSDYFDPYS